MWNVIKKEHHILNNNWLTKNEQGGILDRLWAGLDRAKAKVKELVDQVTDSPSPSRKMQLEPVRNNPVRKSMFVLAICTLTTTSMLSGCDTATQKVDVAQENTENVAKPERADVKAYKEETIQKLTVYDKNILAFKAKIENEEEENKADYRKRIEALEQQNSMLKTKLDDFQEGSKAQWEALKKEMHQGMEAMDSTLNDSTATL